MANRVGVKHANYLEKQLEKLQKLDEGSHQKKKRKLKTKPNLPRTLFLLGHFRKNGIAQKSKDKKKDLIDKIEDFLKNKQK